MRTSKRIWVGVMAAAAAMAAAACGSDGQTAQEQQPQAADASVVMPLYDALNQPMTKDIDKLITESTSGDWQACGGNDQCNTQAEVIAFFKGRGQQVPDLKWDIKEIIVSGNRVIVRGEGSGTPVATFLGIPPTGKAFHVMSIDVHTIANNKIKRSYHLEDWFGGVQQLQQM